MQISAKNLRNFGFTLFLILASAASAAFEKESWMELVSFPSQGSLISLLSERGKAHWATLPAPLQEELRQAGLRCERASFLCKDGMRSRIDLDKLAGRTFLFAGIWKEMQTISVGDEEVLILSLLPAASPPERAKVENAILECAVGVTSDLYGRGPDELDQCKRLNLEVANLRRAIDEIGLDGFRREQQELAESLESSRRAEEEAAAQRLAALKESRSYSYDIGVFQSESDLFSVTSQDEFCQSYLALAEANLRGFPGYLIEDFIRLLPSDTIERDEFLRRLFTPVRRTVPTHYLPADQSPKPQMSLLEKDLYAFFYQIEISNFCQNQNLSGFLSGNGQVLKTQWLNPETNEMDSRYLRISETSDAERDKVGINSESLIDDSSPFIGYPYTASTLNMGSAFLGESPVACQVEYNTPKVTNFFSLSGFTSLDGSGTTEGVMNISVFRLYPFSNGSAAPSEGVFYAIEFSDPTVDAELLISYSPPQYEIDWSRPNFEFALSIHEQISRFSDPFNKSFDKKGFLETISNPELGSTYGTTLRIASWVDESDVSDLFDNELCKQSQDEARREAMLN